MKVFTELEQGTSEWLSIRAGIPTASEFSKVAAKKGPRGGTSHPEFKGRTKYLYRLAGERITGEPEDTYSNFHMERGQVNEAEARALYAFEREIEPVQVGFVRNGNCGCSPDSFLGTDGLLEIKDAIPSVQVARLVAGTLPPEHRAQVQGQLMVTERVWCDFMSHSRGLPPLIVRVERDEEYIAELRGSVDQFAGELEALVEWLRAMQ